MSEFDWSCPVCQHANRGDQVVCPACGCPVIALPDEIRARQTARAEGRKYRQQREPDLLEEVMSRPVAAPALPVQQAASGSGPATDASPWKQHTTELAHDASERARAVVKAAVKVVEARLPAVAQTSQQVVHQVGRGVGQAVSQLPASLPALSRQTDAVASELKETLRDSAKTGLAVLAAGMSAVSKVARGEDTAGSSHAASPVAATQDSRTNPQRVAPTPAATPAASQPVRDTAAEANLALPPPDPSPAAAPRVADAADAGPTAGRPDALSRLVSKGWHGQARLWKVWWLLGLPLNMLPFIVEPMLPSAPQGVFSALSLLLASLLMLGLVVAWTIMAWRCSPNVRIKAWTWVARLVLIFGWLGVLAQVFEN